jgi:YggT family protein
MSKTRIAFIGAGNMAASLIGGLRAQGVEAARIRASDPGADTRARISAEHGIETFADNHQAIDGADVVLIAVKPQAMKAVCETLRAALQPGQLVVSVAAGITCASLARWLGEQPIVRCMPNTPALVRQGVSGLYATAGVSPLQREQAAELLSAVGLAVWLEQEQQLDAVTAVSGSGPAYFFLLIEAMTAAGVKLGLPRETAAKRTWPSTVTSTLPSCAAVSLPPRAPPRRPSSGSRPMASKRWWKTPWAPPHTDRQRWPSSWVTKERVMIGLNTAAIYVLQTLGSLYLLIVMLRFVLQLVRADFYNPLSQFIVRATQPLLRPLRKIIPSLFGLDMSSLVLALILQFLLMGLTLLLAYGITGNPLQLLVWSIIGVTALFLKIFFFAMIISVILSWVAQGSHNPGAELVNQICEPALAPFRRIVPNLGGLDISPILAFMVLKLLDMLVINNLAAMTAMPEILRMLV